MWGRVDKSRAAIIPICLLVLGGCDPNNNPLITEPVPYPRDLIVKPLSDGRSFELVQDFEFVAPGKVKWLVPKKATVDGASIPRPLWSSIGGPFSGKYRDASVIHDFYCDVRVRPSDDVHEVFYHAMIASGVKETKAKVMYAAVASFGPKWEGVNYDHLCGGKYNPKELGLSAKETKACELKPKMRRARSELANDGVIQPKWDQKKFEATRKLIESNNLSLEQIQKLVASSNSLP